MAKASLVLLPGDGIGPEVVGEGKKVLERVAARFGHTFTFSEHSIGGTAIDATGGPLPKETVAACESCDAILLGAVGGPSGTIRARRFAPSRGSWPSGAKEK